MKYTNTHSAHDPTYEPHPLHIAVLLAIQMIYMWMYRVATRAFNSPAGRVLIITSTAFAIGAFVSKLAFIEDWHTLLAFIIGGILGASASILGILHSKVWK